MAEAGDKGIPLEDYIKVHEQPEPLVRAKLDRGELRYTWTDIDGNARASDDGGLLPPRGWWSRPIFTTIDRETHEVRGNAQFRPTFPPMYFVRVFPPVAAANPPPEPKIRRRKRPEKFGLVLEILTGIKPAFGLQPAEVEKKVLPEFRQRWKGPKPDDPTKPPVSRRVISRAYEEYCKTHLPK
jgi:hypothetical protein